MICPIQCVRKALDNGKGEVRLRPELKGLVLCSTVLTREISPGRSPVLTRGSPACSYSVLQLNALRAAGQQINTGKGTRGKAMHGQCRCGPGNQGTGAQIHTQISTRLYLLQDSVSSQQGCSCQIRNMYICSTKQRWCLYSKAAKAITTAWWHW